MTICAKIFQFYTDMIDGLQRLNCQVSKEIVYELKFGDKAVMQQ